MSASMIPRSPIPLATAIDGLYAAFARFSLPWAINGENGEASLEKWIAASGIIFFHSIHAGNVHDTRNFLAGFPIRR